eukprot:jgi/Chrzof1/12287/Cz06g28220.t1
MHVSVLYVGQTWVAQRQSRKRLNFTCACSSWTSVSTARPTLSDPQRNAGRLTCHCLQQVQGSVEAAPQQPFPDAKAAGALEPVPSAQTLIPSSVSASQSPFPPPPDIGGVEPRSRWNAASLAFLGDSLWEVYMRQSLFGLAASSQQYANKVVDRVNTQAQVRVYEVLASPASCLTARERQVLKWGANSSTVQPPANASSLDYKKATAVEVLVAHLYLTDEARLLEVLAQVMVTEHLG